MAEQVLNNYTAWEVSKYGIFSGPYFPVFGMNTRKYGPQKTPYLNTFQSAKDYKFGRKLHYL